MSAPALIWEGVRLLFELREAPLPVRMPIMASRPTKVVITRPGWMGER